MPKCQKCKCDILSSFQTIWIGVEEGFHFSLQSCSLFGFFKAKKGVGKELRLWQVDCPVKSWLRVLSVNECQALSATFLLGLNGVTYSHFHKSFSSFYCRTDKITHLSSSILSFCTKGRKEDVCRRSINPGCSCSD